MTYINQDVLFFFNKHQTAFSLYEVFDWVDQAYEFSEKK